MQFDSSGNRLYSYVEMVTLGIQLALDWRVIRVPDDRQVLVSNWHLHEDQVVGQPGVTVLARRDGAPISLVNPTIEYCSEVWLIEWVIGQARGVLDDELGALRFDHGL